MIAGCFARSIPTQAKVLEPRPCAAKPAVGGGLLPVSEGPDESRPVGLVDRITVGAEEGDEACRSEYFHLLETAGLGLHE